MLENIRFQFRMQSDLDPFIAFVSYLRQTKVDLSRGAMTVEPDEIDRFIADDAWMDVLDVKTIDRLGSDKTWNIEDILDCILSGEYVLSGVKTLDSDTAILEYDPLAFPFGGTDPLKALTEAFGFVVTGDSFHDGFAERKKEGSE